MDNSLSSLYLYLYNIQLHIRIQPRTVFLFLLFFLMTSGKEFLSESHDSSLMISLETWEEINRLFEDFIQITLDNKLNLLT